MSAGGCHCGAVRYEVDSVMQSMICHCLSCQRVSGAPVVAWITVAPGAFRFTKGEAKPYASSHGIARSFCATCGTQLTYARDDDQSYIDITTASLDEPNAFPPSHHSWVSHDIAWITFGDDLPKYQKSRGE